MSNSTPLSQVVDIPSKGKGVIALAPISPGTLIVAESPLVVLNDESFDRKGQLSPRELRILATYPPLDGGGYGEDDTWRFKLSNGIPRGDGTAAIYKTVTRVNHSCAPNSAYHWNAALQKEVLHAITPISSGEEICVSYGLFSLNYWSDRQKHLQEKFRFTCICARCSLPTEVQAVQDARVSDAISLTDNFATFLRDSRTSLHHVFSRLEEEISILLENGVICQLKHGCRAGYLACVVYGDEQNAKAWAKLSVDLCGLEWGKESPATLKEKRMWEYPTQDMYWRNLASITHSASRFGICSGPSHALNDKFRQLITPNSSRLSAPEQKKSSSSTA